MTQYIKTLFFALITIFFAFSLIIFPKQSLEASLQGFTVWSEIVFPSLLPFFIVSQLMISFGIVQFLGVLLEPIMQPLFRVPGAGGFAWVLGMASGYPAGAKMSVQLREKKVVTQIEAERLVSFTNASSPLFIFGAIAIGFFKNATIGILIAISHYVSNALVGICMRFYGKNEKRQNKKDKKDNNFFLRAFKQMHKTRLQETRPLGMILSDAVTSSIKTLIMIGGFIILFSVLTKMFQLFHITFFIANLIKPLFLLLSIPVEMAVPFITSLFEVTIGIKAITSYEHIPLLTQLVLISFFLGFNGLSVQAQVASVISHTDIRFFPYFISRFLHGIFASLLTILLFKPIYLHKETIIPSISKQQTDYVSYSIFSYLGHIGPIITFISLFLFAILYVKRLQRYE